jgi:hypothetical protein
MGKGADHDLNLTDSAGSVAADHFLKRQLGLRDLVLAQVLTVVGSSWVGIAAGVGQAQFLIWLLAFAFFYAPMAIATYYLNREMPLEGGLYEWTRRSFGDGIGFMTAWNIWAYALSSIATILFQIPSEMAYMIGPAAAGLPENRMFVYALLLGIVALLTATGIRGLGLGKWIHNVSGAAIMLAFALLVAPLWVWLHGALHYAPLHAFAATISPRCRCSGRCYSLPPAPGTSRSWRARRRPPAAHRAIRGLAPIILSMFVLGTASVVSLHELRRYGGQLRGPNPPGPQSGFRPGRRRRSLGKVAIARSPDPWCRQFPVHRCHAPAHDRRLGSPDPGLVHPSSSPLPDADEFHLRDECRHYRHAGAGQRGRARRRGFRCAQ